MFMSVLKGIISRIIGGDDTSTLLNGLASWWTLDEESGTRIDSHGTNDLTDNNSSGFSTGKQSNALDLNGSSQFLSKTSPSGMNTGDNSWSVACWVRLDELTTDLMDMICCLSDVAVNSNNNDGFHLAYRAGSEDCFDLTVRSGAVRYHINASTFGTPSTLTWYFLYAYFDSDNDEIGISVNNGVIDTNAMTATPNTKNAAFTVGRWGPAGSFPYYLNGQVDELGFWNRVLTSGEVTALYNSGAGMTYSDITLPPVNEYDPDFLYVTLLLHMNGADASTVFTDDSWKSATVTPAGDAQIDTAQSKYGGASGYFDGAGDYLTIPYVYANHNWFEEDYTLECWVRAASWTGWDQTTGIPVMIGNMGPTNITNYWSFGPRPDGTLAFHYYNGGANIILASTGTLAVDTWHHIALTYDHSTGDIDLWINGVNDGGGTKSGTPLVSLTYPLSIGSYNNYEITGWIDDLRITKGVVRYTGTFTPPEAEHLGPETFTGIRQDMVAWYTLDETSGTRVDSHARGLDLTDDTTTGYVTGKQGNAADFASDYMSSPSGFPMVAGDNSWSACCWINWDSFTTDPYALMFGQAGSGSITGYNWYLTTNGSYHRVVVAVGGSWTICLDTQVAISTGTWHFAYMQYDADTNKLGISIDNNTLVEVTVVGTPNAVSNPTFRIGSQRSGYGYFDGKIDEAACWNRLLTAGERTTLYNSGNGVSYIDIIGFQPTDIAGCVLWLDASDPGSTTNQWDDKSGNGNHFLAASAGEFPTIAAGVATFDGAGDHLDATTDFSALTEGEIFMRLKSNNATNSGFFRFGTTVNQEFYQSNGIYTGFGRVNRVTCGSPILTITNWHTCNIRSSSSEWVMNLDGAEQHSLGAHTPSWYQYPIIGGHGVSYWFNGDKKAVVMYDRVLTATERAQLEVYLAGL